VEFEVAMPIILHKILQLQLWREIISLKVTSSHKPLFTKVRTYLELPVNET